MEIILIHQETKPYPYRVKVTVGRVGDGLVAVVEGGDKPHIGSIAVAIPRSGLKHPNLPGATVSVYNLIGHKDDQVASPLADLMARTFRKVTVVLAGIHLDKAKQEDIANILTRLSLINNEIINKLKEKDVIRNSSGSG